MIALFSALHYAFNACLSYPGIVLTTFVILIGAGNLFRYWKFRRSYRHLPSFSYGILILRLWISGKIHKDIPFTSFLLNLLLSIGKRFVKEGIYVLWGIYPYVFILNEKYVKEFSKEPELVNKPFHYNIFEEMSGKGLLTSNGSTWKQHRKMLNPVFRFDMLKTHVPIFNKGANAILKDLRNVCDKPTVEVVTILKNNLLKILFESMFEIKIVDGRYDLKIQRYIELLARLGKYTIYRFPRPWFYPKYLQLLFQAGREHRKLYEEFHNFTKDMIMELKHTVSSEDFECSKVDSKDDDLNGKSFTRILLENHLKNTSLTMEDVQGQISTFIFAGHDTTSYTLLWCLFMLGHHPDIQERALEEVKSVTGKGVADISYEHLSKLTYLESVIKETLRLYPAVPVYGRQTTKEIDLGEYKIPKKAVVVVFLYLLHRNPDIFPEPDKFDPERFYGKSLEYPWAYVPFSEGIRSCIGKRFAMMEIKIVLAHILRNFKVTSLEKNVAIDWNLLITPVKPISFLLTQREGKFPQG